MPRYKLRVPLSGDWLYGDGDRAVVADSLAEARAHYEDEYEDDAPRYLHSYIGRCRVLYKADVENGDCHEDAEPGDTTVDYCNDDGRDLRPGEIRVWMPGAPPVFWKTYPLPQEPVGPDEIPEGVHVHHARLGSGRTVGPAVHHGGRRWFIPVEFRGGKRRACSVLAASFLPSNDWPKRTYRLEVAGEHVADGSEDALRTLRDARVSRLNAEWEAEQDRADAAAALEVADA